MASALVLSVLGIVVVFVQFAAALPWLAVLNWEQVKSQFRASGLGGMAGQAAKSCGIVVIAGIVLALFLLTANLDPDSLQFWGGLYGAVLQAQLIIDFFVLAFAALLPVWPKGTAVALAAFREGIRQPMFWFIIVIALFLMLLMPVLPYFTFGEDYKMVKDLGYSTIMLCAAIFGVLNASISISEEIEGRTAVTLMSKPVSRRQFLLGKFAGILLACLVMTGILSWVFDGVLLWKLQLELAAQRLPMPVPDWLASATPSWETALGLTTTFFLRGCGWWFSHVVAVSPGVVLGFCHVMVLTAIAVALATRLPMIMNVVTCLVVFFLGNLTPILAQISQTRYAMVRFMAQVFDTLLPGLDLFNMGAAIARDTPLSTGAFTIYISSVALYAVLYTAVALLFGLILFEDRDLA